MDSNSSASNDMNATDAVGHVSVSRLSLPDHLLMAVWVGGMLLLSDMAPEIYEPMLEEDRAVEWATVFLFGAAGIAMMADAWRRRSIFTALVGVFCLFVAGEEFSWGQRLLGFGSPEYFLEHNFQQELNLHNLPGAVVKPKWIFIIALAAYGLLLPLAANVRGTRVILARLRASAPPLAAAPWFAVAITLLLWYPATLTGEWTECLAGALFLACAPVQARTRWILIASAIAFGLVMTEVSKAGTGSTESTRIRCATIEAQALLDDLLRDAATDKLIGMRSVHKRVFGAVQEEYVSPENLTEFARATCVGIGDADEARRKYYVDVWGTSYWLSKKRQDDGTHRVVVYSFGPNRRRDGEEGFPERDDIAAIGWLE